MNKTAVAFMSKDRTDLTKRTIVPLLGNSHFDLHWFDGSETPQGLAILDNYANVTIHRDVKGGADPAVVYALTTLYSRGYDYIGLVENDVVLHEDFFGPMFALFERGKAEGLEVGAVSARCYVDRILCQRDGYSLMHGLGWGQQLMTRQAVALTLKHMRTHWTTENRRTFARLSGIDIGNYWAFRTNEHWTTPDWGSDAVLASHGLTSLALTPSPVEMVGQKPSLKDQGLELAIRPVEDRRNDEAFNLFAIRTADIRGGVADVCTVPVRFRGDDGNELIFSHQLAGLPDASWTGDWRLKWSAGLGGFAARGFANASFTAMISGTCRFMVLGGEKGGQVAVEDLKSGYVVRPQLLPEVSNQVTQVVAPATVSFRPVRLTVLSGSAIFFGIGCVEPQPSVDYTFSHDKLWPAA